MRTLLHSYIAMSLYNEDSADRGIAEVILGKNRGGEPATVRVAAKLANYKFDNLAENINRTEKARQDNDRPS